MLTATIKRPTTLSAIFLVGMTLSACQKYSSTSASSPASSASSGVVNGQLGQDSDIAPNGLAESVVVIAATFPVLDPVTKQPVLDPKTQKPEREMALCTGTLINPQVVLTAGHCIPDGEKAADISVGLHVLNAFKPPQGPRVSGYAVKAFAINPGYISTAKNTQQTADLSLLLLAKPVPAGTRIATLAPANFDLDSLTNVLAIGYGQSDDRHSATDDNNGAGTLRYTTFPNAKFGLLPPTVPATMKNMIVAKADTTSVCHGDSGGPLMAVGSDGVSENMLVGVNDMVLPSYTGQQEKDFEAAMKTGSLDGFYKQYPNATICMGGLNVFVNISDQVAWINQATQTLLQQAGN